MPTSIQGILQAFVYYQLVVAVFSILNENCPVNRQKCKADLTRKVYSGCTFYKDEIALWCDQSNYKSIPYQELGHVREARALYVNDSCLESIDKDHLEIFTEITSFSCDQNNLEELPGNLFTFNTELKKIGFCGNRIRTLDQQTFKGLAKLESLNLASNLIENIHSGTFLHLESLKELSLHNNQLTALSERMFVGLNSLRTLSLTGNKIKTIRPRTFQSSPLLDHLYLDDNQLTTFADGTFENLHKLKVLTISHNNLTEFPKDKLKKVHTLNLGFNLIKVITAADLSKFSELQNLGIEFNALTSLPDRLFRHNPNLRFLNITRNKLASIGQFTFARLCHLQEIYLKDNKLTNIHREWLYSLRYNEGRFKVNFEGNSWMCDCHILSYIGFLSDLRDGANDALRVTCVSPSDLKGKITDKSLKSWIVQENDCKQKEPTPPPKCTRSPHFNAIPSLPTYTPIGRSDDKQPPPASDNSDKTSSPDTKDYLAPIAMVTALCLIIGLAVCVFRSKKSGSERSASRAAALSHLEYDSTHQGPRRLAHVSSVRSEQTAGFGDANPGKEAQQVEENIEPLLAQEKGGEMTRKDPEKDGEEGRLLEVTEKEKQETIGNLLESESNNLKGEESEEQDESDV